MKIVVFGANGMVGSRVLEILENDFNVLTPSDRDVDITDYKALDAYLSNKKPQAVINFAAVTDVDACEKERENKEGLVWRLNAIAPKQLSELSKTVGFYLVQISTDMVFSGSDKDPGPYDENHRTGSYEELTWYGASKACGEKAVIAVNSDNAVVRIVYPVRAHFLQKLDYVRKIIKLYDEGKLYPMFGDQKINITFIDELAAALKILLNNCSEGIFHVSSNDTVSPYELASYLLEKVRGQTDVVKKSSYDEFVKTRDPRRYPKYGGLKSENTQKKLNISFSKWHEIINYLSSSLQIL